MHNRSNCLCENNRNNNNALRCAPYAARYVCGSTAYRFSALRFMFALIHATHTRIQRCLVVPFALAHFCGYVCACLTHQTNEMTFLCRYFGILFATAFTIHQPSTCERDTLTMLAFALEIQTFERTQGRMKRAPIFQSVLPLCVCVCMECFVRQTKISAEPWEGEFNVDVWQRRSKLDCVEWEIWQQWNWFRMVFGEWVCVCMCRMCDVNVRCERCLLLSFLKTNEHTANDSVAFATGLKTVNKI